MKLKKSIVLPCLIFSVLALIVSISWRSINRTEFPTTNTSPIEKKKALSALSFVSYKFETIFDQQHANVPVLDSSVFKQAYIGYLNLREQGKTTSSILTIADLSLHSREPRLWIIDVEKDSILLNTYVSHGRGSGLAEAKSFSNRSNSNQSSLGFYLTGETYQGKHGRSLRLDGLDRGFNSNARSRAIVMHGAWYVGPNILKGQDRMGVSQGCPAVSEVLKDKIIDLIKDRSVLYIYGKSSAYQSALLNEQPITRSLMAMASSINEDETGQTMLGDSSALLADEGNLL
ncbi:murein L,D-transpeptidase catalytic domain family protein [Olivibacter sp. SDN3]|uniref:murein L,D-transpeptidase catalytic domain family protein n=1 Tax=Olivibacter sp. SDN3 TaxID=2764720 RepID=UPI0016511B34|nr:murein L,D-transpeptidase catalytic domain family protein [Olivibacter sp. SDN3]QNL50708.1 murein L,D-transpeptidase catalytic domain family protein [Olivibacter sp. SDN3]